MSRERVLSMGNQGTEQLLREAEAYNRRLSENPELFFTPERLSGYQDILDPDGTGLMCFLTIPKLHLKVPVYHGTGGEVLNEAAGHMEGSSFPVGGAGCHAVISAHRGLPSAPLFTDLPELSPGDRFVISVLDRSLEYEVDRIETVLPEETEALLVVPGADLVTLMTCTPYGINTHRLLVRGRRVLKQEPGETAAGNRAGPGEAENADPDKVAADTDEDAAADADKTAAAGLSAEEAERREREISDAKLRKLPYCAAAVMAILYFLRNRETGGRC